jgi:hypothetical protein
MVLLLSEILSLASMFFLKEFLCGGVDKEGFQRKFQDFLLSANGSRWIPEL